MREMRQHFPGDTQTAFIKVQVLNVIAIFFLLRKELMRFLVALIFE